MTQAPSTPAMRAIKRRPRSPAPDAAPPTEAPEAQAPPPALRVETLDKAATLFFGCLVVGLLLASMGMFASPILQQVGLLGPIAATIAFPILGLSAGLAADPQIRERFADNCYYLGFIFTQAALLFGFLPVAVFSRSLGSEDVLRFFGVAIGASMAGLIARTLLIQTGRSVTEVENALHSEIETLARAVSDRSRRVFGQFETLSQDLGTTHEALSRQLQAHMESIAGSMRDYQALLRGELEGFDSGSTRVAEAATKAERAFDGHQRTFGEDVRRAADTLDRLQVDLASQVGEARDAIQASAASLAEGAAALKGLSSLAEGVGSLHDRVAVIDSATQNLDRTVHQAADLLDRTTVQVVDGLGRASERVGGALESAVGRASEMLQTTVDRSTVQLDDSARQARETLGGHARTFDNDLQGAVTALQATLGAFRDEMERLRLDAEAGADRARRSGGGRGKGGPADGR